MIKRYNMKRFPVFISVISLLFITAFGFVSCGGTPPPVIQAPEPPPPPPPQPPKVTAPELSVSLSPRYFSPDGDGVDDELIAVITCRSETPIDEWKIEIREPEPPNLVFFEVSGKGNPPPQLVWDGRSASGELVQSASDYPFSMTVKNTGGMSAAYNGKIETDVLVIRDGNKLRVQVPSIVFGSNSGGFTGIDDSTLSNNDSILRRIAQTLNKFDTYKVIVEGHANATAATAAARRTENQRELIPLSAQRARYVMDYLIRLGVDSKRLSSVGVGYDRPIAQYSDRNNWWKNRRVEFILEK